MKLWHKLRNGAYFVDVILLVGAIIAIIGLATFVRLHNTNEPKATSTKGILTLNVGHLDTLTPAEENSPNGATSTTDAAQTVGPADASSSSQLQSTATAPEVTSPSAACRNDCDSVEIETPKIKTPVAPIKLPPVKVPVKGCDGIIKRAADAVLNKATDQLQCPQS